MEVCDSAPTKNQNSEQKSLFQMAAAMCQALPSFYSDFCRKSRFNSVFSDFYKKYLVTHDYCVSTHNSYCSSDNCKFTKLLIGSTFDQILQQLDKFHFIFQARL